MSSKGRQWGYTLYNGIYGWIALSQTNYENVASIYAGLDPADSSCGQAIIDGVDGQTTLDVYMYATGIKTSLNDYDVLLQGIYDGTVYFGLYYMNGNKYVDYFVSTDEGLINVATLRMTMQYES